VSAGDPAAYRRLFAAHVSGLLGTGVAVVALGLVAFELVGLEAGAVLGLALALKTATGVLAAPAAAALAARLPLRPWLVALCLARAGALAALPFVSAVWHIYALVLAFQIASAAFTAAYMALTPELLPNEEAYARALAKGRIAYELETLASPMIAAALLAVIEPRAVFFAAAAAFVAAAVLSARLRPPAVARAARRRGAMRLLMASAPVRAALVLSFAGTVVAAMATVNTVVLVRGLFGRDAEDAALALAVFGGGAVVGALAMPGLLDRFGKRDVMFGAAVAMAGLLATGFWLQSFPGLLALWAAIGAAASLSQLPTATLVRAVAAPAERQAAYAAQFSLRNAQAAVAYAVAGWLGAEVGLGVAFQGLAAFAAALILVAAAIWPARLPA
jgi:MFS family permease